MNSKAQAWFMDFAISLLLFAFTIVVYLSYTNNFQQQDQSELNNMLSDANSVSSSLVLSGYPTNWDNRTVIRIGIADDQKINSTKIKNFKQLNYSLSKKDFATTFDYFVFFVNDKNEVMNVYGVCGVGNPQISTSYNIKSAYYYQDEDDSFLKYFMNKTFKADIYFKDNSNDINGLYGFISNLSKYKFIVMEHPLMTGGDFASYKDKLENYSSNGGLLMISGELATPSTNTLEGVDFNKKSGQSISNRISIVNNTNPYLSFTIGQIMVFAQYYNVVNNTATNFQLIATFNQSGEIAVANWNYGNGTTYFFSDFDVSNFNGNFIKAIQDAAQGLVGGICNPINVSVLNPTKLVKTERYLNYNSKIVRMVVELWQ